MSSPSVDQQKKERKKLSTKVKEVDSEWNIREFLIVMGLLVSIVAFLYMALGNGEGSDIIEAVDILDDYSFDSWIEEHPFAMASWDVESNRLSPKYEEAALQLAETGSPAKLAIVDGSQSIELMERYDIKTYPTLLWFSKDYEKPFVYRSPKEVDALVQWINARSLTKLPKLQLATEVDSFLQETKQNTATAAAVVLHGDSTGYTKLVQLARTLVNLEFRHVTDENEFGEHKSGEIVVFPSHSDEMKKTKFVTDDELHAFITAEAYPAVSEFSPVNFRRMENKKFTIIGVDQISEEKYKKPLITILQRVATGRDDYGFLYGDSDKLKRAIEKAGASGTVLPTLLAINPETNEQFAYDEDIEFTVENINFWLDSLADGTAVAYRKSLPIPDEPYQAGVVTTLVYKNFHEKTDGKNVLVMYFGTQCEHCKVFAPVYEELASVVHQNGWDVLVTKMDVYGNYMENPVTEIPSVLFYSATGEVTKYPAYTRQLSDLLDFVRKQLNKE